MAQVCSQGVEKANAVRDNVIGLMEAENQIRASIEIYYYRTNAVRRRPPYGFRAHLRFAEPAIGPAKGRTRWAPRNDNSEVGEHMIGFSESLYFGNSPKLGSSPASGNGSKGGPDGAVATRALRVAHMFRGGTPA
jgi:hypothetical protein